MSYADSLLVSGERVLRRERQHWFVMVWNARYAVGALVLAGVLLAVPAVAGDLGPLLGVLGFLTLGLFVLGILFVAWSWLRYQNEEYVVTSRRIIHAEGVINKKATDSSLEKINDAILLESLAGRIFGFGDLDVLTASETGIEKLRMLRDAKGYKKAMLEAKHDLELEYTRPVMPPLRAGTGMSQRDPGPGRPATPPSPTEAVLVAAGDSNGSGHVDPSEPASGPEGSTAPRVPTTVPGPGPLPGAAARSPGVASTLDEVSEALDRLAGLRDRGVITPEEFAAKKQDLLARL
jgi:hypothetical protein